MPPSGKHSLQKHQSDMPTPVLSSISSQKKQEGKRMAHNNNRGMTYQTNEKHLTNLREHFVGAIIIACYCYNSCFLSHIFTNTQLKCSTNRTSKKLLKCYVLGDFDPTTCVPYYSFVKSTL